jgi:L-fuconolactonase
MTSVRIVDSHCHVSPMWFEPVEALLFHMDRNGVEHAVLVQMIGQTNNSYLAECAQQFPDRFVFVGLVDVDAPDALCQLERLAEAGATGVRLRPSWRSPGQDPLAIWRAAERLNLAVSCIRPTRDFASQAFADLVAAVPDLPIVVEHMGELNPNHDGYVEHEKRVLGLSAFPNVLMKIGGLGEFSRKARPMRKPFPFDQPIPPLLERVYAAFGASRLMWGSDFPPVSNREGYANALCLTRERFATRPSSEQALSFGDIARRVFRVPD